MNVKDQVGVDRQGQQRRPQGFQFGLARQFVDGRLECVADAIPVFGSVRVEFAF